MDKDKLKLINLLTEYDRRKKPKIHNKTKLILYIKNCTLYKMNTITTEELYHGPRDDTFKEFIFSLLKRAKLKTKYINVLLSDENLRQYSIAFTSITVDKTNNFEVYEQLGDLTANKFIVTYMYERFPKLFCTEGVKVVARLRINYGAKQSFYSLAEKLGYWKFISASVEERSSNMKPLLEDCFESFIGVTEYLLDSYFKRPGIGNAIVYKFLKSVFDEIPISLRYEDLIDAKTRLKELFDCNHELGVLDYEDERDEKLSISKVYRVVNGTGRKRKTGGQRYLLGTGRGNLRPQSQQNAAKYALSYLKSKGIEKADAAEFYKKFY